ncbi:RluA family pseudouridine synthase [Staphylococcus coagulans]|uniref:RNA pseudouridylate synthase n=1 Tax=Staphylococcus coagulans TaxID=74706 RepID=A0ABU1EYW3_9STAP|nr:RluA family pseudouridine synthase [Staphylococcus coagulans]MDR5603083.1 RluA family pseudouridine synthase [Staphylococcus coagulans]
MIFKYHIQTSMTLKSFLYAQQFSKKTISAIKQNGALLVNGDPKTVRYMLQSDDTLEVHLPKELPSPYLQPFLAPLDILYEDEWLLVVVKPQQQNTAPSREHPHESLVEQVLAYMQLHNERGIPHVVTRLDRNTTGIVIIAKSRHVHHLMSHIEIEKYYECICHGVLEQNGFIDAPIARDTESIIKRMVSEDGKSALTYYAPIKNFKTYTWCRVKLETGRTHQIRVHFEYINAPLVGDTLYGGAHPTYQTQLLKCAEVRFVHPLTNKEINIRNQHPNFEQVLTTL